MENSMSWPSVQYSVTEHESMYNAQYGIALHSFLELVSDITTNERLHPCIQTATDRAAS